MAASHDNFFITTLIDRATGESVRVRDVSNGTAVSRIAFAANADTDTLGLAGLYAYTATGSADTLTLSTALLAFGTPANPYKFRVVDEGGAAGTDTLTVDTEGAEVINGPATITSNFGQLDLYTDGSNYFSA